MRIGKTVKPGKPGSARWIRRFGDRLISVRYRYDRARSMRYTTVELVVDTCPWTPRKLPRQPDTPEIELPANC